MSSFQQRMYTSFPRWPLHGKFRGKLCSILQVFEVNKLDDVKRILLGHGGGGKLSRNLIDNEIVTRFAADGPLAGLPDGASLQVGSENLVFSTDSFVVSPLEFPGGDIGKLAVHGTVNDVSVSGAVPKWLSLALIIEEGLEISLLQRILDSVKEAADEIGVQIVTGDTKVVARGQCDRLFINTAGIGRKIENLNLGINRIQQGDVVITSGTLGDHGMAIMAAREKLTLNNDLKSDTGSVHRLVAAAAKWPEGIKFMRDPTRGGIASALNEIADSAQVGICSLRHQPPARCDVVTSRFLRTTVMARVRTRRTEIFVRIVVTNRGRPEREDPAYRVDSASPSCWWWCSSLDCCPP